MKNLKTMLLSLALFAVVGLALAFKAKSTEYCVKEVTSSSSCQSQICSVAKANQQIVSTGTTYYCTVEGTGCNSSTICESDAPVRLASDGGIN